MECRFKKEDCKSDENDSLSETDPIRNLANTEPSRPFRLLVILSHPVQYFSPLFVELAKRPGLDVEVWFGHRGAVSGMRDEQFGTEISWGTDLLEGYRHRFFRNFSLRPRLGTHFWGVLNPGMIFALIRNRPDAVLIPGWAYASYPLMWIFAMLLGVPVWIRTDNPWSQEKLKSGAKQKLKNWFLRRMAFPSVSRFLAVGKNNADWYQHLGVSENRIVNTPHAVDTDHFYLAPVERDKCRMEIRSQFGIPVDACLFLFVGKLMDKKRPMDVLRAASNIPGCNVLFAGAGHLGAELRSTAQQKAQGRIHFAGFVNQVELPSLYAAADMLILPSGMGEAWGLVVNEAMACGLPVLVSDLCGCTPDLVRDGVNGFQFPCGDVASLQKLMQRCIDQPETLSNFGKASERIIQRFTVDAAADGFEQAAQATVLRPSAGQGR